MFNYFRVLKPHSKLLQKISHPYTMKNRYVIAAIVSSILLASCSQLLLPATATQNVENPSIGSESGVGNLSDTSVPDLSKTEKVENLVLKMTELPPSIILDPTKINCSGELTSHNQEGPFYKFGSPERDSLIDEDLPGVQILIIGRVFDQDCNPLPGVKLDFWLADVDGEYDNEGYTLRGHQFSDENGFFSLESIEPTSYTGRPPHIHVKLFNPDGEELLTTQMYFPGSEDSADVIAAPDLYAAYLNQEVSNRQVVLFNFIVEN